MIRMLAGPAIGFLIAFAAVSAWQTTMPVTVLMRPHAWSLAGGAATATVAGYKLRDCSVVADSFVGFARTGGVWQEDVPFDFPGDRSPNSSKPSALQKQSFGKWRWNLAAYPGATYVKMTMQHLCGDDVRLSVFGPWELPKPGSLTPNHTGLPAK
ncbi:hypothetical protein [Oricola cellulosilytica]|uniref:Uncharacterized protein n=1 Tax=Oricola cellulosilytica TaxID=1429082 RepID=A0A4V2MNX2_9HYPH|nr:hypothetical protein [Oricola cellulosilytica]TCD15137.1 hypothetical protein E0D97_06200 [Oricola cellulosilytica]